MTAQSTHIAPARATVYYNEIDPYCAAWLQNLMDAGHIPHGVIDTRSIEDVPPDELAGFTQCHFFAGLGGWAYALQLAGWGARPVWTGSCPCQPFSAAGKGAGFEDERHLWPVWQHLIAQCRPAVVFGEQVASKDADAWIDLVHADLEGMGYAFGCVPFPSAGIGAPHIRDRNYWVADATRGGWREEYADGGRRGFGDSAQGHAAGLVHGGSDCRLADAEQRSSGCEAATADYQWPQANRSADQCGGHRRASMQRSCPTNGPWRAADWLACTDGKWRPVEPGTFPLAHGIPTGMGKLSPELRRLAQVAGLDAASLKRAKQFRIQQLKGYGNAIVPQSAQAFIESYFEARGLIALEEAA